MTGSDYTTTTTLTNADGDVIAETGARCDAVPSESLAWLIDQGVIVPVDVSAPAVAPVEAPEADTAEDTDEGNED